MQLQSFKEYFTTLSDHGKELIIKELLNILESNAEIKEEGELLHSCCPHCKSKKIRGNGFSVKGVQKYFCNDCKKNFSDSTGQVWCWVKKKDEMKTYIYGLLCGYSIRKCAKECGISINTSFIWRHKLLSSFSEISSEQYKGILEVDELFFRVSEKGNRKMTRPPRKRGKISKAGISDEQVAVIATTDRMGNKGFKVAKRGRITKANVAEVLDGKIEKVEVLCSDKHVSYAAYSNEHQIPHKTIMASHNQRVTEKIYHVQNVNNMDKRLRDFLRPRNGVASKYLQNYLNWFLVMEKIKNQVNRYKSIAGIIFASGNALEVFKQISNNPILLGT
jgi:transposase-like protein